ncbi:hypothetical protein BN2476_650048 [Paraburkholderia piptadeniae]|uniref:Uncharacterized protein n=1 Tax=Paraburkholderia piptadeniae TaxID=1701573 RepID=A0A1N7SN68_9BURK|nr:hypothetical protein BN2476_650048 [Paraburkholderia piptadeniae]
MVTQPTERLAIARSASRSIQYAQRVLARGHRALGQKPLIDVEDLRDFDWILPPSNLPPRQLLDNARFTRHAWHRRDG